MGTIEIRTKIPNGLCVRPIARQPMARAYIGQGRLLLSAVNGDSATLCHRDILGFSHERSARNTSARFIHRSVVGRCLSDPRGDERNCQDCTNRQMLPRVVRVIRACDTYTVGCVPLRIKKPCRSISWPASGLVCCQRITRRLCDRSRCIRSSTSAHASAPLNPPLHPFEILRLEYPPTSISTPSPLAHPQETMRGRVFIDGWPPHGAWPTPRHTRHNTPPSSSFPHMNTRYPDPSRNQR